MEVDTVVIVEVLVQVQMEQVGLEQLLQNQEEEEEELDIMEEEEEKEIFQVLVLQEMVEQVEVVVDLVL